MKKLLSSVVFLMLMSSSSVFEGCSESKPDPAPAAVPPNTQLNSLFDNVYLASSGFQDASLATPIAEGKQVWVLKDLVGDKDLTWNNSRTVPSPMWPAVPQFYNDEVGGYIFIPNLSFSYWASKQFAVNKDPLDIYVVLRDMEAQVYEYYFDGPYGVRNKADHLEFSQRVGGTVTYVQMDNTTPPTILDFNKRSILRLRIDGANSSLWLNNVQVNPAKVNLGPGGIIGLVVGSGSHIAQHDFYGIWVNFGTLTPEDHKFVYDELVKTYTPGVFPDKPFANKIKITGNAKSDPRVWTADYEFVSTSGTSEDVSKREYQWGYRKTDPAVEIDLNTANFFIGPNAKKKTLNRSDFPSDFLFPGKDRTAVFVMVKVYDTKGDSWTHVVRSPLYQDNY